MGLHLWYSYACWGLLLASVFAEKMYNPYGPKMCERLRTRHGKNTTFDKNSLTCVVRPYIRSSKNMSGDENSTFCCGTAIENRKQQFVCVPDETRYRGNVQIFATEFRHNVQSILQLDVSTCTLKKERRLAKRDLIICLACSSKKKTVYFLSQRAGRLTLGTFDLSGRGLDRKVTMPLPHLNNPYPLAFDTENQILFCVTVSPGGIWKCNIKLNRPCSQFVKGMKHWVNSVSLFVKRRTVFACTFVQVFSVEYDGKQMKTLYSGNHDIRGIAYDPASESIYFGQKDVVKKMSADGNGVEVLIDLGSVVLSLEILEDLLVLSSPYNDTLILVDWRTSVTLWSREIKTRDSKNRFFCSMDMKSP